MSIISDARARSEARARAIQPIDYARMNRAWPQQRAALTRAIRAWQRAPEADLEAAREKIAAVCKAAVAEWNAIGAWPDDWARFQRALDDALGLSSSIRLEDL